MNAGAWKWHLCQNEQATSTSSPLPRPSHTPRKRNLETAPLPSTSSQTLPSKTLLRLQVLKKAFWRVVSLRRALGCVDHVIHFLSVSWVCHGQGGASRSVQSILGTRSAGLICFPHWVADAQSLHRKPCAQCGVRCIFC